MNKFSILSNIDAFLLRLLQNLEEIHINPYQFVFDHIAYRCLTEREWEIIVKKLKQFGLIISQSIISGRNVYIFKLNKPLIQQGFKIDFIEVLFPKPEKKWGWWDHIEVTISNYKEVLDNLKMNNKSFTYRKT